MKCYYDLHIHSALSPCADNDMTPNNILGMAAVNGLHMIAVADHNAIKNVETFLKLSKEYGVEVVPAFELQTAEDIHFLCLFPNFSLLEEFYRTLEFVDIKNDKAIFGEQLVMDEGDNTVGEEERLLLASAAIYSYRVGDAVKKAGGIAVPAHVDREANGMISILGGFDGDYGAVEFSPYADAAFREIYGADKKILINSDSHTLGDISEAVNFLELRECTARRLIDYLRGEFK
ncbi:MAG: PHP domain-containing protein [Clostridiales bacterium]|jgi:PHP family Zn ribbon phosphoesterase|nr:PHP domain-containing protein [Clostridiales bacterium]